jgi:antitoxin (DNA-binding transcriptional repressor) of toxin-antitoxin stability system
MDYVTVRDLRSTPKQVWEKLSRGGRVVLTNNGKPKAVMVEVDSSTLEETLAAFEQAEVMRLLGSIHRDSINNGTDQMSMDEIDAQIAAVRKQKSHAK